MKEIFEQLLAAPLAILFPAMFVGLTWLGILLVRPFLRLMLGGQRGLNDLVSHASAGFSLLYGLLLGLLSVAAFDNNARIESAVQRESASVALLYRGFSNYEEPLRSELRYLMRDYTTYVLNRDWPAHQQGLIPTGGDNRLAVIRQSMLQFEPESASQGIMQEQGLTHFDSLLAARVDRLAGVNLKIPGVFWYVVIIGAIIQIILIWMLEMRLFTQMLLSGLVAFFLGVMIFLIYALDEPLQGAVLVSPTAYELVYGTLMELDDVP